MSEYSKALDDSMKWLSEKEDTVFIGQGIKYGGIAIANFFKQIKDEKKIEVPVAENLQLGISTGLAMNGYIPISIYPRWNFLILAADQLINHLDKISLMSSGDFRPKVIIRVASGIRYPIDPQEQHVGNFSKQLKGMLKTVEVIELENEKQIFEAYKYAYERKDGISTILSEEHQF